MKKGVPANRYTLFIHSLFYSFVISFIGLRRVNGTFLLHGLRTEFKRIWPYGHWASAIIFGSIAVVMDLCAPALGGVATTVRSSFRLNSVSNPRKVVKVPFIPRNPMNNDTPPLGVPADLKSAVKKCSAT